MLRRWGVGERAGGERSARPGSVTLALLALVLAASARAEGEPTALLQRIVSAAQTLNYTGTFIYQRGMHSETSRVTHLVDAGAQRERLEVLDGSPREVVRTDDEVRCFLPADHVVVVERQAKQNLIPARLPESLPTLSQYYRIRKGESARVAGFDSHLVILDPKDRYRYGHMLWAEASTGLLLKSRIVNEKGEAMEQFAFTQLQIGGNIDPASLRPRFDDRSGEWKVRGATAVEDKADDGQWVFRASVPGFRRSAGMTRHPREGAPGTTHYVFSDGMAAMSVFIDRVAAKPERSDKGFYRSGATNVYQRVQGEYLITVLGEVPPQTLQMLGDGIEQAKR